MISTVIKHFPTKTIILTRIACNLPGVDAKDKSKPVFYATRASKADRKTYIAKCKGHEARAAKHFEKYGLGHLVRNSKAAVKVEDHTGA